MEGASLLAGPVGAVFLPPPPFVEETSCRGALATIPRPGAVPVAPVGIQGWSGQCERPQSNRPSV